MTTEHLLRPIQEAQHEQIDQEREELRKEVEDLKEHVQQLKKELRVLKDLTEVLISRAMKMGEEYLELPVENGSAKLPRTKV